MRVILLAAIALLVGCDGVEQADQTDPENIGLDGTEVLVNLDANSSDQQPLIPRTEFDIRIIERPGSRTWVDCDDYIVNNPASGFCQEEVPDDWTPLQFNGKVYFFVALGG